jgi:hypothetical protein
MLLSPIHRLRHKLSLFVSTSETVFYNLLSACQARARYRQRKDVETVGKQEATNAD